MSACAEESARQVANSVASKANAAAHGVAITLHSRDGLFYVIWTVTDTGMASHSLLVSGTSPERLEAHAVGFIENRARLATAERSAMAI